MKIDNNYLFILGSGLLGTISTLFSKYGGENANALPILLSILVSVLVPVFNSKALRTIDASTVTMIGFVTNFLSTAFIGWLGGEIYKTKWFIGIFLMLLGTFLCISDKSTTEMMAMM